MCLWSRLTVSLLLCLLHYCGGDVICPYQTCTCTDDVIDCSGRGLTQLPALTVDPDSTVSQKTLDISNNSITIISDDQLPHGLQEFISKDNPISSISDDAFKFSEDSLQKLVISSSDLSSIPAAFHNLTALTSLTWSDNLLTQIPNLCYLTNLLDLDLSSNGFTNSPSDKLPPSLGALYLDMNSLTSIPSSVSDIPNLTTLDVSDNNIESVDQFTFPNKLQNLFLSHNDITEVNFINFKGSNPGLRALSLSNNPLKMIGNSTFSNLVQLKNLDLSSTSFLHLPQALTTLTSLSVLRCNHMSDLVCDCTEASLPAWYNRLTSLYIQGQCGDSSDLRTTLDYLSQFCPNGIFG